MRSALQFVIVTLVFSYLFAQPPALRPNRAHDPNREEELTFVLRPEGFGITKLQLPSGKYAVLVLNRSGREDVPIALERAAAQSGNSAVDLFRKPAIDKARARHLERLVLSKGTYRLFVPNRGPESSITIEVN